MSLGKGSQGDPISPNKAQTPLIVPNRPHWVAWAPLALAPVAYMKSEARGLAAGKGHRLANAAETAWCGGRSLRALCCTRASLGISYATPRFPFEESFKGAIGPCNRYSKLFCLFLQIGGPLKGGQGSLKGFGVDTRQCQS